MLISNSWVTIIIIIQNLFFQNDLISLLRNEYHHIKSEEENRSFIEKCKNLTIRQSQPYLASAIMRKAEYVFFPHDKLKYFNRGKKLLETYISNYPNCLEGRYVRVLVQRTIPRILGYNANIDSDIKFIKENIAISDLPEDYQQQILSNIKNIR